MRWKLFVAPGPLLATSVWLAAPATVSAGDQSPPAPGAAQPVQGSPQADEIAALKDEVKSLRQDYESRIAALESRLAALEAERTAAVAAPPTPPAQAPQPAEAAPSAPVPAGAATGGSSGTLPVYGANATSSKVFNPDISAIGNFVGVVGKSPGGGEPSLNMQESELGFQAVVDPYARADFFVTVGPEEVALEEGYITFPTLPGGLLGKVGKFRDAFGKVDAMHAHVLPFVDRPLMNKNLLGGEDALADAGISVARLIPNPWLFLEATAQVYQGNSVVFKAPTRGDLAYVGHLRAYRDLGESTNLDLGGSIAYGHNGATADTTTRLLGVDATLRWKPLRRSIYTHLLLSGELTWSRREQLGPTQNAVGGYGFLEYQLGRRWTAGLRYDNSERADDAGIRDSGGSFILSYRPSEFSLVRGQYRHTKPGDQPDPYNEFLFQFLFAIGAHGAHPF
jgi:hypothetical protein